MPPFHEIDTQITTALNALEHLAPKIEFSYACELTDQSNIRQHDYAGLYKIEIKKKGEFTRFEDWFEWFQKEWELDEYRKEFTPNTRKKRVVTHTILPDWVPLYIGKARNISKRVSQHINIDIKKPTTALKLKSRKNMGNQEFRLSTLRVSVKNYDSIVPQLERIMRDRYNPILGRQ